MISTHLWMGLNEGMTRVLCGFEGSHTNAIRPHAVTCPQCLRRMVQWNGMQTGLPAWTAYRVDAMASPGLIVVAGTDGDAIANPGDWLIDLGGAIRVLPAVQGRADA